jgi:hypothetical protein
VTIPGNDARPTSTILAENQAIYTSKLEPNITLYSLIDALMERKEIDLYYYLLNQASIVSFSSELIEISSGNNRDYNLRLENIISSLAGKQIKITVSQNPGIPLKKRLIEDLEKSKLWTGLNDTFPRCEILDIIHKNGC